VEVLVTIVKARNDEMVVGGHRMSRVTQIAATVVLMCLCACRTLQPAASFGAGWEPGGILRLSKADRVVRIDLRRDVAGCLGEMFDPTTGERFGVGEGNNKVLDVVERDREHFVMLSAQAMPNCNIQGSCGAAPIPNVTLVWVHVAPDLSVVEKQAFAIVDCVHPRSVLDAHHGWQDRLELRGGSLTLAFVEGLDDVRGRATYDRRTPQVGIRIVRD
jgi:hypothetical protein